MCRYKDFRGLPRRHRLGVQQAQVSRFSKTLGQMRQPDRGGWDITKHNGATTAPNEHLPLAMHLEAFESVVTHKNSQAKFIVKEQIKVAI